MAHFDWCCGRFSYNFRDVKGSKGQCGPAPCNACWVRSGYTGKGDTKHTPSYFTSKDSLTAVAPVISRIPPTSFHVCPRAGHFQNLLENGLKSRVVIDDDLLAAAISGEDKMSDIGGRDGCGFRGGAF